VESVCLAEQPLSKERRFAAAVSAVSIVGNLSYAKVQLMHQLLLVVLLLLLLLLVLPPLIQLLCCCHQQECTTPLATRVPFLQSSVTMLLRDSQPSPVQIRP
jgi:hypothetical protein